MEYNDLTEDNGHDRDDWRIKIHVGDPLSEVKV